MTLVHGHDSFATGVAIISIIEFIAKLIFHVRNFYENFVFVELIGFIIEPLELLNESVSADMKKLSGDNVAIETIEQFRRIRDNLEKWIETIQFLIATAGSLRDFFGAQIALSLCSVIFYKIALLYDFIGYSVRKHKPTNSYITNIISLVSYLILKLAIVSVGQRAQNQSERLRRHTASLHSKLAGRPEVEACARAAAGLARQLRATPLRVRLLSSTTVQMALLAYMITLIADSTIVLLQFNHVV